MGGTSGSARLTSDSSWRLAGIGDFNGDGRDDVLVRHNSGRWYYYAMNGRNPIGGTSGSARLTSDSSWRLAGIGDLNGDGRDDVLVRHTSGRWYYYAMKRAQSHWRNERQRTPDQRYELAARRHRRSQPRPTRRRARAPHLRALVLLRHERAQPHWRERAAAHV